MPSPVINLRALADNKLIEMLASPIRQEIVDTIAAMQGEASAADLADQLGRHADGLYYHLKLLCDAKLLEATPAAPGEERRYRLAGEAALPLRLAYRTGRHSNAPSLRKFAHGLLQVAEQDFTNALDMKGVTVEGPQRQLWVARNKAWVNKTELKEINRILERLCELMSQTKTDDRDQLLSCAFVLAPLEAKPKRRGKVE